jgi:hypothetical protein
VAAAIPAAGGVNVIGVDDVRQVDADHPVSRVRDVHIEVEPAGMAVAEPRIAIVA